MSTQSASLTTLLQDPITHKLLWDPVYSSCCGQRLDRSTIEEKDAESNSIIDQACTSCMKTAVRYFKDRELRQIVRTIYGLINSTFNLHKILGIDAPNHVLVKLLPCGDSAHISLPLDKPTSSEITISLAQASCPLCRKSVTKAIRDTFREQLYSLLSDENSIKSLKDDSSFQEMLQQSFQILSTAQIKVLNPTPDDPFFLLRRTTIITGISFNLDFEPIEIADFLDALFNRIFLLKGKTVSIEAEPETICEINSYKITADSIIVSIHCNEEMRLTVQDGNLITSPADLHEQMLAENQFLFSVKSGQPLTLTGIAPEICRQIVDRNIDHDHRLALLNQVVMYATQDSFLLWGFGSLTAIPNNDYTQLKLISHEGSTIECSLRICPTQTFTARSFAEFLKKQEDTFQFTGATSIVFEDLAPDIETFFTGQANDNIGLLFEYLAPLAGKKFKSFLVSVSSNTDSSFEPAEVAFHIIGPHSVRIFFNHDTTCSFSNQLQIENLKDFFNKLQTENIIMLRLQPEQYLYIVDPSFTPELLEEIVNSEEAFKQYLTNSTPRGCRISKCSAQILDNTIPVLCLVSDHGMHLTAMPPLRDRKKDLSSAASSQSNSTERTPEANTVTLTAPVGTTVDQILQQLISDPLI